MPDQIMKMKGSSLFPLLFLFTLFSLGSTTAWGIPVTHLVRPRTHFQGHSTQMACSTFSSAHESWAFLCNPAAFSQTAEPSLSFDGEMKSDGEAIDNGEKLIFRPIEKSFLEHLFTHNSFNSFTFNSSLDFLSPYFQLSYSPYYVLADVLISNPAFPELAVYLAQRKSVILSSGKTMVEWPIYELKVGGNLVYFDQRTATTEVSLLDFTLKSPQELIPFQRKRGIEGDLGFLLQPHQPHSPSKSLFQWPRLSLQLKNLGSPYKVRKDKFLSEKILMPHLLFETYSTLGLGQEMRTSWGKFNFGLEIPFAGLFQSLNDHHLSLAAQYSLGLFTFVSGLSRFYKTWGIHFASNHLNIGILYAREKDLGLYQKKFDQSVYLSVEIKI